MKIKIPELTCPKCGHKWTPRKAKVYQCPKCKVVLDRYEGKENG
ncbi:MAG: zinc ribbon domain-containing protein [Thermodesulfobacteriota bacterium]